MELRELYVALEEAEEEIKNAAAKYTHAKKAIEAYKKARYEKEQGVLFKGKEAQG